MNNQLHGFFIYTLIGIKIFCTCCNTQTTNKRTHIAMKCLCDDEYRFLNIDEILLGFHNDKVYLLTEGSNSVYGKNANNLQKCVQHVHHRKSA